MAKKEEKTQIDKDLETLYNHASGNEGKSVCPHCGKDIETKGDFSEMARAMELRIKYELIKQKGGPKGAPSFFEED